MSAKEFIERIQQRQDDAMQRGNIIELVVLPIRAAQMIADAARKEDLSEQEFRVSDTGNVYVANIKVLWSNGRLPDGEAWFRYGRRGDKR